MHAVFQQRRVFALAPGSNHALGGPKLTASEVLQLCWQVASKARAPRCLQLEFRSAMPPPAGSHSSGGGIHGASSSTELLDRCTDPGGLSQLLRVWDSANETRRGRLTQAFVHKFAGATEPGIEQGLANGGSLLLARLGASLRLTFLLPNASGSLELKIHAIRIFITATGGHRFLVEFMETGGALTLLEILIVPHVSEKTCIVVLELLIAIANAGPRFRDLLVESQAGKYIEDVSGKRKENDSAELLQSAQEALDALK